MTATHEPQTTAPQPNSTGAPAAGGQSILSRLGGALKGYAAQIAALSPNQCTIPQTGSPVEQAVANLDLMLLPMPVEPIGNTLGLGASQAWLDLVLSRFREAHGVANQPDAASLGPALEAAGNFVSPPLTSQADGIRTSLQTLMNDSSVAREGRNADPTLPTREDFNAWHRAITAMRAIVQDPFFPEGAAKTAMLEATASAEDAALAGLQALSVIGARETWRLNDEEEAANNTGLGGRDRTAVDDAFRDSGFGTRQSNDSPTSVYDWCGMFVGSELVRGAGLDEELRSGLYHTSNVRDLFQYQQNFNAGRSPASIWADGRWWNMREYHQSRGSVRTWTDENAVAAAIEARSAAAIRAGDVVLIDHTNNGSPNHIVMVEAYDPVTQMLTTIEGNTRGIKAADDGAAERNDDGHLVSGSYRRTGTGVHTRDLKTTSATSETAYADEITAQGTPPRGAYQPRSGNSVYGVGRPSIVDMEEHTYATRAVPEALRTVSPSELTSRQQTQIAMKREQ